MELSIEEKEILLKAARESIIEEFRKGEVYKIDYKAYPKLKMELGAFIDNLYDRKLDSWMAGWGVPLPLQLKPYWYSDPNIGMLNFACYGNLEIDKILDKLDTKIFDNKRNELVKDFQEMIHQDEPVTFLYWTPNIVAYNKRIKNINVTPYGVITHCWEWSLNE